MGWKAGGDSSSEFQVFVLVRQAEDIRVAGLPSLMIIDVVSCVSHQALVFHVVLLVSYQE